MFSVGKNPQDPLTVQMGLKRNRKSNPRENQFCWAINFGGIHNREELQA